MSPTTMNYCNIKLLMFERKKLIKNNNIKINILLLIKNFFLTNSEY